MFLGFGGWCGIIPKYLLTCLCGCSTWFDKNLIKFWAVISFLII